MLDFAVRLARLYGGRLVHIQAQHGEAAVSYVMRESTVIIKEIAAMGIDIDSVLAILHSHLDAPRYEVSLPPQKASPANADFAMIHPLAAEAVPLRRPYFNLAMD